MPDQSTTQTPPRLEVRSVSKTFAGRTVLSDAGLAVAPGQMHGIVGQNGSGKSTLAKVIAGYHAPDPGAEVIVDGRELPVPVRLGDLRAAGVGIVHQDLGLIETGTVVENVRIAALKGAGPARRIHWDREAEEAKVALDRLGFRRSLRSLVKELPPVDRARVAIARAIQEHRPGQGVLIFDESTRALPTDALEDFYATLRRLLDDGTAALMIGHRLGEILEHCDQVTVLRDGRVAAAGVPTDGISEGDLATRMLGHSLARLSLDARERVRDGTKVTVRGLVGEALAAPLDLDLEQGGIVGLTGLPGSGFEAVPYLLAGAAAARGTITIDGEERDLARTSLARLVAAGVALVPEDRPHEGLALTHTMAENIALPWIGDRGRPWMTGRAWQEREARAVIERLGVVPPDPGELVGKLSGGNQQKVLLGKWLVGETRLLLLDEPTQAVDVKARQDLLRAIHDVAAEGTAVILASSEPEDLVTVCDRVLLFRDGAAVQEIAAPFDADLIIAATYSNVTKASAVGGAADRQGGSS
ncbi:MAG: sugar ABC transporter ATP-binding protein [Actinobacteria bacterium]|nr:sugar ABC transporter ATP-binding protein [Actinomycetota bacterium]